GCRRRRAAGSDRRGKRSLMTIAHAPAVDAGAEWTFMFYCSAVNDCPQDQLLQIANLKKVAIDRRVRIAYQLMKKDGMERGFLHPGGGDDVVMSGPYADSGVPSAVTEFADWAMEKFPSRHAALVIMDHGGGFEDDAHREDRARDCPDRVVPKNT